MKAALPPESCEDLRNCLIKLSTESPYEGLLGTASRPHTDYRPQIITESTQSEQIVSPIQSVAGTGERKCHALMQNASLDVDVTFRNKAVFAIKTNGLNLCMQTHRFPAGASSQL